MVKDNKILGISTITIFQQNICGLRKKIDELKSTMDPNLPHILCFSEHHLKTFNLTKSIFPDITLVLHTADKMLKEVESVSMFITL